MAFMFETRYPLSATAYASQLHVLDGTYPSYWDELSRQFGGGRPSGSA
jgi:homogentisate 1,2-dioxygenase